MHSAFLPLGAAESNTLGTLTAGKLSKLSHMILWLDLLSSCVFYELFCTWM